MEERRQDEDMPVENIDPNPLDALLVFLVKISNESDMTFGITLNVRGCLISGKLVSGKTYCNEIANQLEPVGGETGKELADFYRNFGEKFFAPNSDRTPEMIHLKDAKVIMANQIYNVGWWRGKIRSVDGYIIGEMTEARNP